MFFKYRIKLKTLEIPKLTQINYLKKYGRSKWVAAPGKRSANMHCKKMHEKDNITPERYMNTENCFTNRCIFFYFRHKRNKMAKYIVLIHICTK